jgi:Na+-translocating membrane potential-generating system (MpsC)
VSASATARAPTGLPAELTSALVSLWTHYAGKRPADARTEVRGNVVTCVLVDAVRDYDERMAAPQPRDTVRGVGKLTPAAYKREAVAAVGRLTRQRVASFVSSHDRDTDVATEIFTLEPSLSRGAPPTEQRFRQTSSPPPPRAGGLGAGLGFRS